MYPPPCRQARQGVFESSSGGLILSLVCLFLKGPQPVTRANRVPFFKLFFGPFVYAFLEPNDHPRGAQNRLHSWKEKGSQAPKIHKHHQKKSHMTSKIIQNHETLVTRNLENPRKSKVHGVNMRHGGGLCAQRPGYYNHITVSSFNDIRIR